MKKTILTFTLIALPSSALAATVTVPVRVAGHSEGATLTTFSTGGGGGANNTRHGLATADTTGTNPRVVSGTSNAEIGSLITGAGTITMTYFLDNTVNASFRPGIEGLYDATDGVTTSAALTLTAIQDFNSLAGVSVAYSGVLPGPDASNNIPASLQTITYTISEGSEAIGANLAFGFHSTWSNAGGYIFGSEAGANDVTITFTAIPEPSAALLGGIGMLALLRRRR